MGWLSKSKRTEVDPVCRHADTTSRVSSSTVTRPGPEGFVETGVHRLRDIWCNRCDELVRTEDLGVRWPGRIR